MAPSHSWDCQKKLREGFGAVQFDGIPFQKIRTRVLVAFFDPTLNPKKPNPKIPNPPQKCHNPEANAN